MLKLYGGARSRATIVQWYLEELAVPYEVVMLDMKAGEHYQPPYLAINPMGKLPAIAEGDFKLWESGAILLYLADQYDPPATPQERAAIAQWVLYANATLGPGVFVEATRDKEMKQQFPALNTILSQQTFLLGDRLTAADIAVGAVLAYMPLMLKLDFSDYGAIAGYLKRLAERPAFQKTIGAR